MAEIKPASGVAPPAGTSVTSDQALASLIEAVLEGGGDGGKAATAWYKARLTTAATGKTDRKSTRLNSSHGGISRMPSSA